MKIAVITAIFGGKDTPKPFPPQSVECDYYCFTEENTPVPLPNLPDRLKAKYFKLQAHRVLPGYDHYIWIDGNIEVKSADFVKEMVGEFGPSGVVIQKHHERQYIGDEINFILASDNSYLTTRYGHQPLFEEAEHYQREGMPLDAPLYACNIFARDRSDTTHEFFDSWWDLVLCWSWFDQSAFSYLAWEFSEQFVAWIDLGPMFNNPYFTLHPHTKPLG
jgi:hypothetical protein